MLTVSALFSLAATSHSAGLPAAATKHWTADNGNGTYSNPLFYEEFEDPDPIRVGNDYYLASTTMHMIPAVIIMHSKDLVNWELAGYCTDKLDLGPAYRLENGNIYGRGIWAPCIRYHDGMFYVFCNVNGAGLHVFRSKSANGPWECNQLPGHHDQSVLFDDDLHKIFIISGGNSPYPIDEIAPDLRSMVPGARHHLAVPPEAHAWAKVTISTKSKAYTTTSPPSPAVLSTRWSPRPTPLTAHGQSRRWSKANRSAFPAAHLRAPANDRGIWLHQGGIVDTPSGQWWCIIMSDHGSAGRMSSLVPITWDNGFPLIGLPGNLRKAPNTWLKPDTGYTQKPKPAFVHDDNFDNGKMNPLWQWNHVPDDTKWSLTEKPGVLRLHSLPGSNFYQRPQQPLPAAARARVHHDG